MTTPALKLNVMICHFPYAGNGACSSESPDIRLWEVQTVLKMKADPRVGNIFIQDISDTPITMSRNQAVRDARRRGAHLLLFIDSDQSPKLHENEPWYKPFWDVAFNEIYNHYGRGPLVIGAPYCGPPTFQENVYVFQWDALANHGEETKVKLEQYTRAQACMMRGVQECGALPTGMILYDMRAFDLIEPSVLSQEEVLEKFGRKEMTKIEALAALSGGYFRYEWKNCREEEKASTEDVQNTRDISLAGIQKLGYNPLRCAWDSWIGHHKPWCVGKPMQYGAEHVSAKFRRMVEEGCSARDSIVDLGTLNKDLFAGEIHTIAPKEDHDGEGRSELPVSRFEGEPKETNGRHVAARP